MINWVSLILRFCMGVVFTAHGLQKTFGAFAGPGISGFANSLGNLGFSPPLFWAYFAAYLEFVGGLFLLLGIATRVASSLLFILMVIAVLKVHLAKGFFLSGGGFEYNFVIACGLLCLIILGSGKFGITKKL